MNPNLERARLLFEQGQFVPAESALKQVLKGDPENSDAHALLALCLVKRKAFPEAHQHAAKAIQSVPDSAYAHYVMSCVLASRVPGGEILFWSIIPQGPKQQPPAAFQAINEAIRLDPENPEYLAHLARLHFLFQQWNQAEAAATAGLNRDAAHLVCATFRALALSHLGKRREAAAAMREVLALDPENAVTQAGQGWLLLLEGRPRAARENFLEALRVTPESLWAQEGLLESLKAEYRVYRWRCQIVSLWARWKPETRFLLLLLGPLAIFGLVLLIAPLASRNPIVGTLVTTVIVGGVGLLLLFRLLPDIFNVAIGRHRLAQSVQGEEQRHASKHQLGLMAILFLFVGVGAIMVKAPVEIVSGLLTAIPLFAVWMQLKTGTAKRFWFLYCLAITCAWPFLGTFLWQRYGGFSVVPFAARIWGWLKSAQMEDKFQGLMVVLFFSLPTVPVFLELHRQRNAKSS